MSERVGGRSGSAPARPRPRRAAKLKRLGSLAKDRGYLTPGRLNWMKLPMDAKFPIPTRRSVRPGGFTLIEAALVTCIIGFGVVSMMRLLAAGTLSNTEATEITIANALAGNIHELTQLSSKMAFRDPSNSPSAPPPYTFGPEAGETLATYDDVDDFGGPAGAGTTFSPPIDARRQTIPNMTGWSQFIKVENVDQNSLTLVVPNGTSKVVRVTVTVSHRGRALCTSSWLVVDTRSD